MKIILAITAITLFFLTATCGNQKANSDNITLSPNSMELTGTIEPIGMTTWQYGTHTLNNDDDFYALRSSKIDLKNYEGKKVTIKGEKVEGYPVENGPVFIEVTEIKE